MINIINNMANNEARRRRFQKLIDDLTRINLEMKTLQTRINNCSNVIKENALIDYRIFQEDTLREIENVIKSVSTNVQSKIIPNLRREMNEI
jgi:chaperonin cofactor prefoldin